MTPRLALFLALAGLPACVTTGELPATAAEHAAHSAFQRDRDACRSVAERSIAYVDPGDGKAVADRSIRVEADIQRCMLSRGWNDPQFDGWNKGRS